MNMYLYGSNSYSKEMFLVDYAIAVMTDKNARVDESQLLEIVDEIAEDYRIERKPWEEPLEFAKRLRRRLLNSRHL